MSSYICSCGSDNKFILQAVPYSVALDCALIISNTAPSSIFFKLPFTQTVLTIYCIACTMFHIQNTSGFIKDIKAKQDNLIDEKSSVISKIGSFFGLLKSELNYSLIYGPILDRLNEYSWDNFCIFFRYDIQYMIVSWLQNSMNPPKPETDNQHLKKNSSQISNEKSKHVPTFCDILVGFHSLNG